MPVPCKLCFALIIGNDRNFSLKTRNEPPCRSFPRVVLLGLLRFLAELSERRNIHTLLLLRLFPPFSPSFPTGDIAIQLCYRLSISLRRQEI